MVEREENISTNITTSDLLKQMLTDEKDGPAFTEAFLKSSFLSSAVDALFCARRQAGLTQAQIAEIMQTKQAAIARLEADTNGSMSLRRYVEFALACGMVPLDIKLVPISSIYNYMIDNPEKPGTVEAYHKWLIAKEQASPAKDSTS